jgi:arginase family enzyme
MILDQPQVQLSHLLAPQGIYTVSTGAGEVARFVARRWGSDDPTAQRAAFTASLDRIKDARVVLLGVPMDAGAGFERGSFKGPMAIRTALMDDAPRWAAWQAAGVVDIGDVRVHPQLTDDAAHSDQTLANIRAARGWDAPALASLALPIAPHSILKRALRLIRALNPDARVLLLGGDHSISRVPLEVLTEVGDPTTLGILHLDAHTDLLELREGFPYSFATWAHQANERIGRGGKLIQVGIRASGHPRAHWEQTLDVRQHWSADAMRDPAHTAALILDQLRAASVTRIYISNDIDATDPAHAAATGTMEPDGLSPDAICAWIAAVAAHYPIIGADLVEVAPPLKNDRPGEPGRTIATAARYVAAQVEAMLGR